jgi:hypothetical protein
VDVSLIGNEKAHQQIYNGAGHEITSVLDCIELMARAVGVRPEPGWQSRSPPPESHSEAERDVRLGQL